LNKLTNKSEYRTPKLKPSWFARNFPDLALYIKFVGITLRSSRMARHGLYDSAAWSDSSHDVLRALESVGVDVTVEGLDVLRALETPCVFIANHMSTLETLVLPCIIQPFLEVTFVVKEDLLEYPVFKHVMRSRDPVVVGRVNPREDLRAVLEGGEKRLGIGSSMIIFPQTTRSRTMDQEQFNTIGVKLARRAGVPIVPIALKTDAWGIGKIVKEFGRIDPSIRVRFAFSKPMSVAGSGREEHEFIVDFITGKLKEWENDGKAG